MKRVLPLFVELGLRPVLLKAGLSLIALEMQIDVLVDDWGVLGRRKDLGKELLVGSNRVVHEVVLDEVPRLRLCLEAEFVEDSESQDLLARRPLTRVQSQEFVDGSLQLLRVEIIKGRNFLFLHFTAELFQVLRLKGRMQHAELVDDAA